MSNPTDMKVQIIGSGYLTTKQGACKVVEILFSLIAALLVHIGFKGYVINIFIALAYGSFAVAAILFLIYMTAMIQDSEVPWNQIQFLYHTIWAVLYLTGDCLVMYFGFHNTRLIVGCCFGFVAIVAHIIDAVDNFKKHPLICSCTCTFTRCKSTLGKFKCADKCRCKCKNKCNCARRLRKKNNEPVVVDNVTIVND